MGKHELKMYWKRHFYFKLAFANEGTNCVTPKIGHPSKSYQDETTFELEKIEFMIHN